MLSRAHLVRRVGVFLFLVMLLAPVAGIRAATPVASPVASPNAAGATPVAATALTAPWLQLGPDGALGARVITGGGCPLVMVDGVAQEMQVRAQATAAYADTVCEAAIPAGARDVAVGGVALRMPAAVPRRILIIGDTGCRLDEWGDIQNCNIPADWPLAQLAEAAAAWQPDLIIHVGDYVYRETACPDGVDGCAGSPFGSTSETWMVDMFAPLAPLLPAAPWIFLRGNHEDCARSGPGWFRYLEPRALPDGCLDTTAPYALSVGDQRVVVMDSAAAQSAKTDARLDATFADQFAVAETLAGDGPAWLLVHHPFAVPDGMDAQPAGVWTTATFANAGFSAPPAWASLVISGHVHNAQLVVFAGGAIGLVAGHGGTMLDTGATGAWSGDTLGQPGIVSLQRWQAFGVTRLELVGPGIVVSQAMADGTVVGRCLLADGQAACVD